MLIDERNIWNLYKESLLLEDAQSSKAAIVNSYVRSKVGHQIFKFKNKPENKDLIEKHKKEIEPTIEKLEKWINELNPKDKNLNDLQHLFKFYTQLSNNPDRDNMLKKDYEDYLKIPSLVNKSFLANSEDFTKWAEEIHSTKKEEAGAMVMGTSNDPNKVYEDEQVIVFLANNLKNPRESVKNCVKYGKGSSLCISGSNARGYYHEYRWEYKLTTYFCWLKTRNRYMLVDATESGGFQYNPMFHEAKGKLIQYNHDIPANSDKIIQDFPELTEAFNKKIFKSIPIQNEEEYFYKKIFNTKSIIHLDNIEDKINYASLKDVSKEEWDELINLEEKDLKQILSVAIETTEVDIPKYILEKFPALETRYYTVIRNRLERELENWNTDEDKMNFTTDEAEILYKNKDLFRIALNKIPEYSSEYEVLLSYIKKYNVKKYYDDIKLYLIKNFLVELPQLQKSGVIDTGLVTSISLPQLQECEEIYAGSVTSISLPQLQQSGSIYARLATSISLPQLQQSGEINAESATSLDLPQLQQCRRIIAGLVTSLNISKLQECGDIYVASATSLNLPQLQESEDINAESATSLDLPQLEKSANINAESATSLNLPQLQECGRIYADSATSLNLPKLYKSGDINAESATSISLPQLQRSSDIFANEATSISLPQLQKSEYISAGSATSLSLPKLQKSGDIMAESATSISLPQLQESGFIEAYSAKKIIIRSHLRILLKNVPEDCEIIEPSDKEELNDSVVYNLMKSFLLKS